MFEVLHTFYYKKSICVPDILFTKLIHSSVMCSPCSLE